MAVRRVQCVRHNAWRGVRVVWRAQRNGMPMEEGARFTQSNEKCRVRYEMCAARAMLAVRANGEGR